MVGNHQNRKGDHREEKNSSKLKEMYTLWQHQTQEAQLFQKIGCGLGGCHERGGGRGGKINIINWI